MKYDVVFYTKKLLSQLKFGAVSVAQSLFYMKLEYM